MVMQIESFNVTTKGTYANLKFSSRQKNEKKDGKNITDFWSSEFFKMDN